MSRPIFRKAVDNPDSEARKFEKVPPFASTSKQINKSQAGPF